MATLHMDKYSRLISLAGIPQLWIGAEGSRPYGSYFGFEYSQDDTPNITPVAAPSFFKKENRLEFEAQNDFVFLREYPAAWVYQMMWYFYRAKNATLLSAFTLIGPEKCLRDVTIKIVDKDGGDSGVWGTPAEGRGAITAVLTIGERTYRLPASGQNVATIATNLANLIKTETVITNSNGNSLSVDLYPREPDFTVAGDVLNATGQEAIEIDEFYSRAYRRFTIDAEHSEELAGVYQVQATRVADDEPLPTLEDTDTEDQDTKPPDLILVMRRREVDELSKQLTFYTVKLRDLLTKGINLNDKFRSFDLEYHISPDLVTKYDFEDMVPLPDETFSEWIDQGTDKKIWHTRTRTSDLMANSDSLFGIWGYSYTATEEYYKYNYYPYNSNRTLTGHLTTFHIALSGSTLTVSKTTTDPIGSYTIDTQETLENGVIKKRTYTRDGAVWPSFILSGNEVIQGPQLTIPADGSSDLNPPSTFVTFFSTLAESVPPLAESAWYDAYKKYVDGLNSVYDYATIGWEQDYVLASYNDKGTPTPYLYYTMTLTGGMGLKPVVYVGCDYDMIPEFLPFYKAIPNYNPGIVLSSISEDDGDLRIIPEIHAHRLEKVCPKPFYLRCGDVPTVTRGIAAVVDTRYPGSLCYVKNGPWKAKANKLRATALPLLETAREGQILGQSFLENTVLNNYNEVEQGTADLEKIPEAIQAGTYNHYTQDMQLMYDELSLRKTAATNLKETVTSLAQNHDQLLADPSQTTAQRLTILDNIQLAFNNYVAANYQVLFNNFASTELIEILDTTDVVYFIIPQF